MASKNTPHPRPLTCPNCKKGPQDGVTINVAYRIVGEAWGSVTRYDEEGYPMIDGDGFEVNREGRDRQLSCSFCDHNWTSRRKFR